MGCDCDCVNGKGKWELLVAPAADVKLFIRDRLLGFVKEKERTRVLSLTPSSGLANHHRRIKDGFDCQIVDDIPRACHLSHGPILTANMDRFRPLFNASPRSNFLVVHREDVANGGGLLFIA
ncbi:hypothetical protein GBA52_006449 [Prunus armeniaca]|nr:hypothetical protein GBA52_006449 [Prunus armeniaca]